MECLGRYTFLVMASVILSCGLNGFEGRQAGQAEQAERSPQNLDYLESPPRRPNLRAHRETLLSLC